MFRIDDPTAATSLPTPEAAGTEGYFTEGNPTAGTPATNVRGSWLNMIQEELRAVVVAGGLTPSKTTYTQVRDAIKAYVGGGRLLRTSVYTLVTGVQNVSVDGGTPTSTGATAFTALSTTTKVEIEVQGGGGGGGGVSANGTSPATAGGGGAGSYGRGIYTSGFATLAITVGAAGTAGAAGNNAGGAGSSSSAGALITAPGGAGGAGGAPNTAPFFNGGTAIGGAVSGANVYSQRGDAGRYGIVLQNANVAGGIGGTSQFGAATASVANGPGGQALNYGAGGGGASALSALNINQAGGPGANGIVIIREYA